MSALESIESTVAFNKQSKERTRNRKRNYDRSDLKSAKKEKKRKKDRRAYCRCVLFHARWRGQKKTKDEYLEAWEKDVILRSNDLEEWMASTLQTQLLQSLDD